MASAELQIPEHIQETQNITREELEMILHTQNPLVTEELRRRAQQTAKAIYGNKIYVRGLIEFTNYCKNNCYYCGIRCSNTDADRYRLSLEQILSCCETGWNLGFRTFVLQGGEDPHFTDEHICQIVRTIKEIYPDCAVTLSIGEKSEESYQTYFNAGADRYLLRHETADEPFRYVRTDIEVHGEERVLTVHNRAAIPIITKRFACYDTPSFYSPVRKEPRDKKQKNRKIHH